MYTVPMRFEVPQFIEVEDKIFGPLTWKQFVYVAGGAGAAVLAYILLPFFLFLLVAGPVVALAAGLAFLPVNNRPLSVFLEAMAHYFASSRLYLWQQRETGVRPQLAAREGEAAPEGALPANGARIASLSRKLELSAIEKKTG